MPLQRVEVAGSGTVQGFNNAVVHGTGFNHQTFRKIHDRLMVNAVHATARFPRIELVQS